MSVIYKVITRPTDPRVPNSPKRYYPHLITLGQSVNLKYIAQKCRIVLRCLSVILRA